MEEREKEGERGREMEEGREIEGEGGRERGGERGRERERGEGWRDMRQRGGDMRQGERDEYLVLDHQHLGFRVHLVHDDWPSGFRV